MRLLDPARSSSATSAAHSQERLEYLQQCANQGYRLVTLHELAADLLQIQNLLSLATFSDLLSLADVQAGVKRWADVVPDTLSTKMVDAVANDSPARGQVASILGAAATSRPGASCLSFSA